MSDTAKVRLVRCPKCENLLPEVNDFSVYQCGGCGAVLRSKNKGVDLDTCSEKSYEERVGSNLGKVSDRFEKVMNVSERRGMMEMSDGSESDVRSSVSSSSRVERRRVLRERAEISRNGGGKDEDWDVVEVDVNVMRDRRSSDKMARDFEDTSMFRGYEGGPRRIGHEESGVGADWRGRRAEEGSFDHHSASSYDFEDLNRSRSDVDGGLNNVDLVGDDRAELLRQLDEIKLKLSRSGNLNEKGKEKVPVDRRMPPQDPYIPPLMFKQEMGENGYYPPRYAPNHVQGYGNPSRHGPSFQMPPSRGGGYMSGPYADDGMVYVDNMEAYPPNYSQHHPSCSCYDCRVRRQVHNPTVHDMVPNYQESHGSFGARDHHNRRMLDQPPLRPHTSQKHSRWPSDVNSEVDGFVRSRPYRAGFGGGGGKHCLPVGGGAPFMACSSCFEVLLLPKEVLSKNGKRKKLRCGACSSLLTFAVSGVVSSDVVATDSPLNVDNERDIPSTQGNVRTSQARTAFSPEDYDFHAMDRPSKPIETKNRRSTSTYASEAEEETKDPDLSREDKGPQPPSGSSLQDYFEHSNKYHVKKESGEGNRSGRSELGVDRVLLASKTGANQISRKESTATEIDIPSNEFSNTGSTFESSEASRGGRGTSSFLAGIMGSFKDKSEESLKHDNANVTINGHLISDRLIKKAEKIAGPIQRGHYWYDFRAGFWGAIGGPCLGIIPPFIEEFNYPMPENCAAGNTHIYVNGRELNHKDLNLLVSRGLPKERDRSYIVEISGRVLDEDTGEELESLGKLAPTMEKAKRGFGMRVPQAVA